jgi:AcrR family transcriptional regulator
MDRRVRRTRAAIQQALTDLILEKGYDSVTVSDIIERADIGRSTFYSHFTDKRDVFDDTISELAGFLRSHASPDDTLFAFSLPLFEHIIEQKRVIRALFGRDGHSLAMRTTSAALSTVIADDIARRHGEASAKRQALAVDFVVGAYTSVIGHWLETKHAYTAVELDEAFRAFAVPGVESVLLSEA